MVAYHDHIMSAPETISDEENVKDNALQKLASSDIKVQADKKFIGNDQGMSLLERLQTLESQVQSYDQELQQQKVDLQQQKSRLQSQNSDLQRQNSDLQRQRSDLQRQDLELQKNKARLDRLQLENTMAVIRAAALDEWSEQKDKDQENVDRNITAHGGKIAMDVETIRIHSENAPDEGRLQKWKEAFLDHYGVDYQDITPKINDVPSSFLTILDRRASVRSMRSWRHPKNAGSKSRIIHNAEIIVQEWRKGRKDFLEEGSRTMELYRQIEKDWCSGW